MSFDQLGLIQPLLQALQNEGYTHPTPIQAQAIPTLLQRRDLLGCAQTGTGKTAAFALPILQLLHEDKLQSRSNHISALILTPTRELAIQIDESFKAYGRFTNVKSLVIFGGVSEKAQINGLHNRPDVVIATPGRLLDLMNQGYVNLQQIKTFVLDEADRMLDMGFIHDVKRVIAKLPTQRQTLFFSATMPPDIVKLSSSILTNPVKVEVTPVSSTAEKVEQAVYFVGKVDKKNLLVHLLQNRDIESALIFTRTKHGANKVAADLVKANISAEAIHGNKSQTARQRALENFKNRRIRVLVATDIAARGIDIEELSHVINFELPNIPESYVHRIGRTGRAGASGIALSFCDMEERAYLKDIEKLIGLRVPVVADHPFVGNALAPAPPPEPRGPRPSRNGRPERNGQSSQSARPERNGYQEQPTRSERSARPEPPRSKTGGEFDAPAPVNRRRRWSNNRSAVKSY